MAYLSAKAYKKVNTHLYNLFGHPSDFDIYDNGAYLSGALLLAGEESTRFALDKTDLGEGCLAAFPKGHTAFVCAQAALPDAALWAWPGVELHSVGPAFEVRSDAASMYIYLLLPGWPARRPDTGAGDSSLLQNYQLGLAATREGETAYSTAALTLVGDYAVGLLYPGRYEAVTLCLLEVDD